MTEMQADPRAVAWMESVPTTAPRDAFAAIMAGVDAAPQRRPRLRIAGRPLQVASRGLLAAAAAVVVLTAAGGYLFRDPILDRLAPGHRPDELLYGFPETRTIMELQGGPDAAEQTAVVGTLPQDRGFVVAVACTGGGEVRAEVWNRDVEYGPDATEADRQPDDRLAVPCDGAIRSMNVATLMMSSASSEVVVVAEPGTTWRIAVGQVRALASAPAFPALPIEDGALVLMDYGPELAFNQPGGGIAIQLPERSTAVTVLVQCAGDPVTIRSEGVPDSTIACDDPGATTTMELRGERVLDVRAGTDGFAWVRLAAAAVPGQAAVRPEAPPLPDGLGDVWFADGDGENVAFGTLGSNTQVVLRIDGAVVGRVGGDHVAIARTDGERTVLELWSMPEAAAVRELAVIESGRVFGSWVDATHEQVFYGVVDGLVGEWRRVAFDGTGDVQVAGTGLGGLTFAQEALAVDDGLFVAMWCPVIGACQRAVFETATGDVSQASVDGPGACDLVGVSGRQLVVVVPACDATQAEVRTEVVALDGGPALALTEGWSSGATVVHGSAGPRLLFAEGRETSTTIRVVALEGTGMRELGTFEHEGAMGPRPSAIRLPPGDWVLLAGQLGDTPGSVGVGRPVPMLLNIETGERIELPNLPHSE